MTQLESARKCQITNEMEIIAKEEDIDIQKLIKGISRGYIIIPKNMGTNDNIP